LSTEAEFRHEVRQFLESLPALLAGTDDPLERARLYLGARFDAGLGALDYPTEHGGRDLPRDLVMAYRQESSGRAPAEAGFGIGISMCLPTIRDHGSNELKERFLRPGLRGDEIWCQLYSEPGAGSDLAGLATRAARDGDEWIINGQKVWTSGAAEADMGILLARTDSSVPKHRGISMLVLPMDQPGVEVRPLRQMTGVSHFNEVFIEDARIPTSWVVGTEGDGWRLAVTLLAYERSSLGAGGGRQPISTGRLIDLARERSVNMDPVVRQDLARLHSQALIVGWLNQRSGIHPSVTKLWRSRQGRLASSIACRLAFPGGAAWDEGAEGEGWAYGVLDSPAHSLGGGTDEIQRNTLGERVLGLPREPVVDRDIPFSEVRRN